MTKNIEKFSIAFTSAMLCTSSVYTYSNAELYGINMDDSKNQFYNTSAYGNPLRLEINSNDYKSFLPSALQSAIESAAQRYKIINEVDYNFTEQCNQFIKILYQINPFSDMKIIIRDDALKASMKYNNREISIKYDYDCPDIFFISYFENDSMLHVEEFSFYNFEKMMDFL